MSEKTTNDTSDDDSVLETQNSTLTSVNKSRETESDPVRETKVIEKKSFSERWKTNRFWLIRGSYYFLRTVWIIVMAIGAFIAWLISMLFI